MHVFPTLEVYTCLHYRSERSADGMEYRADNRSAGECDRPAQDALADLEVLRLGVSRQRESGYSFGTSEKEFTGNMPMTCARLLCRTEHTVWPEEGRR
jgi:hypothetical protein